MGYGRWLKIRGNGVYIRIFFRPRDPQQRRQVPSGLCSKGTKMRASANCYMTPQPRPVRMFESLSSTTKPLGSDFKSLPFLGLSIRFHGGFVRNRPSDTRALAQLG